MEAGWLSGAEAPPLSLGSSPSCCCCWAWMLAAESGARRRRRRAGPPPGGLGWGPAAAAAAAAAAAMGCCCCWPLSSGGGLLLACLLLLPGPWPCSWAAPLALSPGASSAPRNGTQRQGSPAAASASVPGNGSLSEPPPRGPRVLAGLLPEGLALKAAWAAASAAAAAALLACLLRRSLRSRKTKKPRKYDIITTPAERVEMAPLNEDEDDDEDSTVFDIKYR
ncbi:membrane protein FAM174B [Sceloporus undulatus]|uniref:membrane protein FAM174B n=1 Tax=Sceloporus undulatus TaxID=8520 RepID=UPI001C4D97AF|nr:membrane protein FAM174B [Sceloporus undulatus]